ncbi:MAG: hypothetical protein MUE30_08495, partial [Spirosomaceae bacterium]|nr:hypothetical protein [Spirosomataceae bacterium]
SNPVRESFYMSLLKLMLNQAIANNPLARPSQKEQDAWFTQNIAEAKQAGECIASAKSTLMKSFSQIRSSISGQRYDLKTLDSLCLLVSRALEMPYISTFEQLEKWAGTPPKGSENQKEAFALASVERIVSDKKQQASSWRYIGPRATLLAYGIFENEKQLLSKNLTPDEMTRIVTEQQLRIQELTFFAQHHLEDFLDAHFLQNYNNSFKYDQTVLFTIDLTSKLLQVTSIFNDHLSKQLRLSDALREQLLYLRETLMKTAWASGKKKEAQEACEAFRASIEEVEDRQILTATQVFPYRASYLSYASCYDVQKLQEYYGFVKTLECPASERELYIFKCLKCTACSQIRHGRYDTALNTLARIQVESRMIYQNPKAQKHLMGMYHYLLGQALYFSGSAHWISATDSFSRAIAYWQLMGMDTSAEAANVYAMQSEIKRTQGAINEANELEKQAREILGRNAKLNACSFDVQALCSRLDVDCRGLSI